MVITNYSQFHNNPIKIRKKGQRHIVKSNTTLMRNGMAKFRQVPEERKNRKKREKSKLQGQGER